MESENFEDQRARLLLQKARSSAPTPRVIMKSAKLEWALGDLTRAMEIINEGLKVFVDTPKLWMMKGQIFEQSEKVTEAREVYAEATKKCSSKL